MTDDIEPPSLRPLFLVLILIAVGYVALIVRACTGG